MVISIMFLLYNIFGGQKRVLHHLQEEEEDRTMEISFMTTCLNTQGMIVFLGFTLLASGKFYFIFVPFYFLEEMEREY